MCLILYPNLRSLPETVCDQFMLLSRLVSIKCHRRAQWLRDMALDYRLRQPRFESSAVLKPQARLFSLYIALVHSAI